MPQLDSTGAAVSERAFSHALQNALATVSLELPAAPQIPISNQPDNKIVKLRLPTPAVPASISDSTSRDLLTLLLSSQKIENSKPPKDSDDSKNAQQPQLSGAVSPNGPYLAAAVSLPPAPPLVPAVIGAAAVTDGEIAPSLPPSTNQSFTPIAATAVASAAAPGAPAGSPAIPAATESLAFEGHLTASPKQDAAPSAPVQTVSALNSGFKPSLPTQPAAQPAQPAPAQPQLPAAQHRPPANANISPPSIDTVGAPPISAGSSAGKNSSFGQEMKQDGKSRGQDQAPVLPPALHSSASANIPPEGAQNNLNGAKQISASSNGDAQPIINQSPNVPTNVKTDMNLKMQSQSGDNVIVRLSERAGGIQVTVRSSDPATSAMLRHELPSIQAGLEQAGWQLSGPASQPATPQHFNNNNSQSSDQGRNGQHSGYGAQEQQKRRNNSQHQWFELMQ